MRGTVIYHTIQPLPVVATHTHTRSCCAFTAWFVMRLKKVEMFDGIQQGFGEKRHKRMSLIVTVVVVVVMSIKCRFAIFVLYMYFFVCLFVCSSCPPILYSISHSISLCCFPVSEQFPAIIVRRMLFHLLKFDSIDECFTNAMVSNLHSLCVRVRVAFFHIS